MIFSALIHQQVSIYLQLIKGREHYLKQNPESQNLTQRRELRAQPPFTCKEVEAT